MVFGVGVVGSTAAASAVDHNSIRKSIHWVVLMVNAPCITAAVVVAADFCALQSPSGLLLFPYCHSKLNFLASVRQFYTFPCLNPVYEIYLYTSCVGTLLITFPSSRSRKLQATHTRLSNSESRCEDFVDVNYI